MELEKTEFDEMKNAEIELKAKLESALEDLKKSKAQLTRNNQLEISIREIKMQMKSNEDMAKLKLEIIEVQKNSIEELLKKAETELKVQKEMFEKENSELKMELEATRKDWKLELDEHHGIYKEAMSKSRESFEKEMKEKIEQMKAEHAKEMKMKEELFELKLQLAVQKSKFKE